jgi:hypothetical protein
MGRFTSILLVSPLADGQTWVLIREFGYDDGAEGNQDQITVGGSRRTLPRLHASFGPSYPDGANTATPRSSTTGFTGNSGALARRPTRSSWRGWPYSG